MIFLLLSDRNGQRGLSLSSKGTLMCLLRTTLHSLAKAGILSPILGVLNVSHSVWTVHYVPAVLEGFMYIREGENNFWASILMQSVYVTPLIKILWLWLYSICFKSSL